MNDRNLSRRLSNQVVEALKAHGHILVVKGGATALARELDDIMAPEVALIELRLPARHVLMAEPTSTFGDESIDQAVEDMVEKLASALMSSDHVEDVFAEDAVIQRDIFRTLRDGLRERPADLLDASEPSPVTVQLESLGYVAATASRRADPPALRQALDRAATAVGAQFAGFSVELREATFRLDSGSDDDRLELEEAVADELTDLVEQGAVELPSIERRVDLGRPLTESEQKTLRPTFSATADATLRRSGCAAAWEMQDPRTIRIRFTPLSDHDARSVDGPTAAFAREVLAIVGVRAPAREPRTTSEAEGAPTPSSRRPSPPARAPAPHAVADSTPAGAPRARALAEQRSTVAGGSPKRRAVAVKEATGEPAASSRRGAAAKRAAVKEPKRTGANGSARAKTTAKTSAKRQKPAKAD